MFKAQLYLLGDENRENSNTQTACIFDDLETMLQTETKKWREGCSDVFDFLISGVSPSELSPWQELQNVQPQNGVVGNYLTYLRS